MQIDRQSRLSLPVLGLVPHSPDSGANPRSCGRAGPAQWPRSGAAGSLDADTREEDFGPIGIAYMPRSGCVRQRVHAGAW